MHVNKLLSSINISYVGFYNLTLWGHTDGGSLLSPENVGILIKPVQSLAGYSKIA